MANDSPDSSRPRLRRYFRFRLSTLLIAMAVVSVILGWVGVRWYRSLREAWSIEAVQQAGGRVVTRDNGTAQRVWLGGEALDDARLAELVPYLTDFSSLEELDIVSAPVTDEGLKQLERVRQVKLLYVHETQATDEGLKKLEGALPNVDLKREAPDPVATKLAMRTIYPHAVIAAAFSPDGAWFVTGSGDGTLRWWRDGETEPSETVQAHKTWLFAATFSAAGRLLATGGGDDRIRLWDAATSQLVSELGGHDDDVHALAFDPSGRWLYSAGDDALIRVWDVAEGRQVDVLAGHTAAIPSLAISIDGRRLATASRDETIRVWDIGGPVRKLVHILDAHHADVAAVAFSPDGNRIASAGYDRMIRVWDAVSGAEEFALGGHDDWAFSVAFSPDGRRLASSAGDGTLRVWDFDSRRQVDEYHGQQNIAAIRFSPDGRTMASTAADGTIFMRSTVNGALVHILRTRFGDRGLALRQPDLQSR